MQFRRAERQEEPGRGSVLRDMNKRSTGVAAAISVATDIDCRLDASALGRGSTKTVINPLSALPTVFRSLCSELRPSRPMNTPDGGKTFAVLIV